MSANVRHSCGGRNPIRGEANSGLRDFRPAPSWGQALGGNDVDARPPHSRAGGAALIVVISLLGTLAFLGFLFYTFAAQEKANADFFTESITPADQLPPERFWDWALKQLIVGTDAAYTNSALYGSKYALIPNALGTPNSDPVPAGVPSFATTASGNNDLTYGGGGLFGDVQPFDGAGISTIVTGLNVGAPIPTPVSFGFDINQDGLFDPATEPDWTNFVFNLSPAADAPTGGPYTQNGTAYSGSPFYAAYEPDAGYTYPDINSPFLAYDALVRGWMEGGNATPFTYRVIIPSFFRPQLFPTRRGANDTNSGNPSGLRPNRFADLYEDPQTARQVLRPHQLHLASGAPSFFPRFISDPYVASLPAGATADVDGIAGADGVRARSGDTNRVILPFPFRVDLDNDGNFNEMGVWTNPIQGQVAPSGPAFPPATVNYELDVDADGDGTRDAIWMDYDYPMVTLDDGRQFVPMFAVKMIDADALLNVNAHGNAHGVFVRMQDGSIQVLGPDNTPVTVLAEGISFHQSNQGLSPAEVNLSLALTANMRLEDPANPGTLHPTDHPIDPATAQPNSVLNIADLIAAQFELGTNYEYDPTMDYTAGEFRSPSVAGTSNMEALMILMGRRQFERLRNGTIRETRQQILGKHADRLKIRELYQRLAGTHPNSTLPGLADDEPIPSPLPGGWYLDDDGDSNVTGVSPVFLSGATGDDDIDAPGIETVFNNGTGMNELFNVNTRRAGGSYFYDGRLYGVQMPPFVHPIDYLGTGSGMYNRDPVTTAPAEYLTRQLYTNNSSMLMPFPMNAPLMNNPSVFATYVDPFGRDLETLPAPTTGVAYNYWHYNGFARDITGENDLTGVIPWRLGLQPAATIADPITTPPVDDYLQVNNDLFDFLIDEPDEVILEPDFQNPEYDAVFPPQENEGLHLSVSDYTKINGSNRLRQLASINLERAVEAVRSEVAERLTTDTWDRLEPGQTRYQGPAAGGSWAFDRQWEYSLWDDNFGTFPDTPFDSPGFAFPPQFGTAPSDVPSGGAIDPYRPEIRLLLRNERGHSGSMTGDERFPRHRLNLNRILSGELNMSAPAPPLVFNPPAPVEMIDRRAFDDDGNPQFRNLTPHANIAQMIAIDPANPPQAGNITIPQMVHDNINILAEDQPTTDPMGTAIPLFSDLGLDPTASVANREQLIVAQEWWARYDRQRLARDIYVLLYTIGLGVDTANVTNDPLAYDPTNPDVNGNSINDHLEQMAQFAVNYVDALDRDNVITRFEYDVDLTDGWQWTAGTDPFVNGVEAQQLTLSEVVWTRTVDEAMDFPSTAWGDDSREHQFLHVELRSVSPFATELSDETWRIVRTDAQQVGQEATTGQTQQARVTFQRDPSGTALVVGPGQNFTIGANDGGTGLNDASATTLIDAADFYVNTGGNFTSIVPEGQAPFAGSPQPRTDLDLVSTQGKPMLNGVTYTQYTDYFALDLGTDDNGQQLNNMVGLTLDTATDSTTSFDLVLQRRRHLQAENLLGQSDGGLGTQSDDWVEVDRMRVNVNPFDPNSDADVADAVAGNNGHPGIRSQFRAEPLSGPNDLTQTQTTTASGSVNHTIADLWDASGMAENSTVRHRRNVVDPATTPAVATDEFELWQPHFDRDFTSVYELFCVPIYGPELLTRRLAEYDPATMQSTLTGHYDDAGTLLPSLAGRLFTNTDPDGDSGGVTPDDTDDNRWYRLLEYVSVPNRAEEAIRDRLNEVVRTPGKLNLNTMRHEENLAALVDDDFIMKLQEPHGRMTMVSYDNPLTPGTTEPDLEPLGPGSDLNPPSPPPGIPPTYADVRNMMDELRFARDGIDPVNYLAEQQLGGVPGDRTYIPLPGIPGAPADPTDTAAPYSGDMAVGRPQFGSIPFRGLSYLDPNRLDNLNGVTPVYVDPTAHTILRNHIPPIGQAAATAPNLEVVDRKDGLQSLGLFEARPTSDIGTEAYDYHTANRLLAKIDNNSTNRSNVFLCWIVVEFFEAHQPDPLNNPQIVQIGARLEGSPTHRGFFVIDRTKLEDAVDPDSVTAPGDGNGRNDTFRFDWRDFVIHRRTIQ